MPAYNAQQTIKASIDSVLAQTYSDWELIIIDDASKDGTIKAIEEIKLISGEQRITLLSNEKNAGAAQSRNLGISHARGGFLAFLDADDLWHKSKLEKQISFMEETSADISYTATAYMNESGDMYNYILQAQKKLTYERLLKSNLMSCSSVMIRRDMMLPFPDGNMHEDYAVWLQVVRKVGHAYGLSEPLLTYRVAKGTKSSKRISSAKMIYNSYCYVGYGKFAAGRLTLGYSVHSIIKRLAQKLY